MTLNEAIEYSEARARQERATAAVAACEEARRAHLALAAEHEKAADRQRAKRAGLPVGLNQSIKRI